METRFGQISIEDSTVLFTKEEFEMSEKELWAEMRRVQDEDIKPMAKDIANIKGKMWMLMAILISSLGGLVSGVFGLLIALGKGG